MPATSENGQYVATGSPVLAHAYVSGPGVNVQKALPSSPGRTVQFRAGVATIRDERDLIACLRDATVEVVVEREYVDWIAGVLEKSGVKELDVARVKLPASFYLSLAAEGWELRRDMMDDAAPSPPLIELPDIDDATPLPESASGDSWAPPKGKRK